MVDKARHRLYSYVMPKTDEDLTEILQVRVSRDGLDKLKKAAKQNALSLAAYVRQTIYRAAGVIR